MSKELESSSTAEESYSDDDDIRGIILSLNFPNEAYHLEYTDIKTNTPQILPNISLTGTPKSGMVKAEILSIYSSEVNTSSIADITRFKDLKQN